jgi:hypothetical protein
MEGTDRLPEKRFFTSRVKIDETWRLFSVDLA